MMQHIADNHEALLDYLYEEGDPAQRLKTAKHLQGCAACSVAVLEFQSVRGMLRDWTPPASELGFRIVHEASLSPQDDHASPGLDEAQRARTGWRGWGAAAYRQTPAWAQAAAAVVLFAAGVAVSQLDVNYSDGALTVRRGPAVSPAAAQTASTSTGWIALPPESSGAVEALVLDRAFSDREVSPNASPVDTEQLLQRVRAMIDQSEQRQQRVLAQRLSEVATEVDAQHQADLLRIQQSLGQQQDDVMNYLVRTSGGTK
jgi:hypothetical protein